MTTRGFRARGAELSRASSSLTLLLVAALAASLGTVPAQTKKAAGPECVEVRTGWNLFGASISLEAVRAKNVCEEIERDGGDPRRVAQWSGSAWNTHTCGFPINDFEISPLEGLFIYVGRDSIWCPGGRDVVEPFCLDLAAWRAIALPRWSTVMLAEDLCEAIREDGGAPEQVSRWTGAVWETHSCGWPPNNFEVEPYTGVFVRVSSKATWCVGSAPHGDAPAVTILSPLSGSITGEPSLSVRGSVVNADEVYVNGLPATVDPGSNTFERHAVTLAEGENTLVAVAAGDAGSDTAIVSVVKDAMPPQVTILSPANEAVSTTGTVRVTGSVTDANPGARVSVNGRDAEVSGDRFTASVALVMGRNSVVATATDRVGNAGSDSVEVNREAPRRGGARLRVISGDGQSGEAFEELDAPFVVRLESGPDHPLPGETVTFEVSQGSGVLMAIVGGTRSFQGVAERLSVSTDGSGYAHAQLLLAGLETGESSHTVTVSAPAASNEVQFTATMKTVSEPSTISVAQAPPVFGAAGESLPKAIAARVEDRWGTPLADVPVTFSVTFGGGLVEGTSVVEVPTDWDGIARTTWQLGPHGGVENNVVTASVSGMNGLPATFTVSGVVPEDGADTRVSGVVLDPDLVPLSKATVSVNGHSELDTTTDENGQFRINGILPGAYCLTISAPNVPLSPVEPDLPASAAPERTLTQPVTVIAGAENLLDRPVVLPVSSSFERVGGAQDVFLNFDGLEGAPTGEPSRFGVLIKAASTWIYDDQAREHVQQPVEMALSPMDYDKLPAAPPAGKVPLVAAVLMPSGVRFDPPAEVVYPHTYGHGGTVATAARSHVPLVALHPCDRSFTPVTRMQVSADASFVATAPGTGLRQSGVHAVLWPSWDGAGDVASGCPANWSWSITAHGEGGGTNDVIELAVTPAGGPQAAEVSLEFLITDGSVDEQTTWQLDPAGVVEFADPPTASLTTTLRAVSPGTAELSTPIFERPDGSMCRAELTVRVPGSQKAATPSENSHKACMVTVASRSARPRLDGSFIVCGVPVGAQPNELITEALVTCPGDGETRVLHSEPLPLQSTDTNIVGPFTSVADDPIPTGISIAAPSQDLEPGLPLQLTVTAAMSDGSDEDVTASSTGTTYRLSDGAAAVGDVTDGRVVPQETFDIDPRPVVVTAVHEGKIAALTLLLEGTDSDSDGMHDGFEGRHRCLYPWSDDSDFDADGDGLSNLDEYVSGTSPCDADTDEDGILDAVDAEPTEREDSAPDVEIIAPRPGQHIHPDQLVLLSARATDNGVVDFVEFRAGPGFVIIDDDPPYETTFRVPRGLHSLSVEATAVDRAGNTALASVSFAVTADPRTTVTGVVRSPGGGPASGAEVRVEATREQSFTTSTGKDGRFTIAGVPSTEIRIVADAVLAGSTVRGGTSGPFPPVAGGTTDVGTITLASCRELFFDSDFVASDLCFAERIDRNDDDHEAQFFRSLTRLLRICEDQTDGPDVAEFSDSVKEMLDRLATHPDGRGLLDFSAEMASALASNSPQGADYQRFFDAVWIDAFDAAAEKNLEPIPRSFQMDVTREELDQLDIEIDGPVLDVDYGDTQMMAAGFKAMSATLRTFLLAFDIDVDVDGLLEVYPPVRFERDLLDAYPNLFGSAASGEQILAQAKSDSKRAIELYFAGSHFVRNRDDPNQSDDMFQIVPEDLDHEEESREGLGEAYCSLDGVPLRSFDSDSITCADSGSPVIDEGVTDLSALFDTGYSLRTMLPPFDFHEVCRDDYVVKGSVGPHSPFPDPTLGGVDPLGTQEELIEGFELYTIMDVSEYLPDPFTYPGDRGHVGLFNGVPTSGLFRAAPLEIERIYFEGAGGFYFTVSYSHVSNPWLVLCSDAHWVELAVHFYPDAPGSYTDTLVIETNDEFEPVRRIDVHGEYQGKGNGPLLEPGPGLLRSWPTPPGS